MQPRSSPLVQILRFRPHAFAFASTWSKSRPRVWRNQVTQWSDGVSGSKLACVLDFPSCSWHYVRPFPAVLCNGVHAFNQTILSKVIVLTLLKDTAVVRRPTSPLQAFWSSGSHPFCYQQLLSSLPVLPWGILSFVAFPSQHISVHQTRRWHRRDTFALWLWPRCRWSGPSLSLHTVSILRLPGSRSVRGLPGTMFTLTGCELILIPMHLHHPPSSRPFTECGGSYPSLRSSS